MWKVCYLPDDCDVDKVMDGLKIDRSAVTKMELTKEQLEKKKEAMKLYYQAPNNDKYTDDVSDEDTSGGNDSDAED